MIHIFCILAFLFDDLNFNECETKANGYTCTELTEGINKFNKIFFENQNKSQPIFVSVIPKRNRIQDIVFARIMEVILSIFTHSIPAHEPFSSPEALLKDQDEIQELYMRYSDISVDFMNYYNYTM